jgi:peptidoglycan/xylan/chitin deacetylase (PgdA/CDA1 family)
MSAILILNYHRLTEPCDHIDPRFLPFTLAKDEFIRHLELIRKLGLPVVDLAKIGTFYSSAPLSVAITFDDGHSSDLLHAAPALRSFGFPATFFPVTGLTGTNGYLDWNELAGLYQQGFSIGSHSVSHRLLHRLPKHEMRTELSASKQQLENRLGIPIDLFAIPYGRTTPAVSRAIWEAGYELAFSTEFGLNASEEHPLVLKRWNIRRTTTTLTLEHVLQQRMLHVTHLRIRSAIRKQVDRVTNRLYPT